MEELPGGLRRVTMPLPTRPGHVHCYLLPVDDGFMLVDTGLGLPDAAELWAAELAQLDGPRRRRSSSRTSIPTTSAPRPTSASSPARASCRGGSTPSRRRSTWKSDEWSSHLADWFRRNGVPDEVTEELIEQGAAAAAVHPAGPRPRARRRRRHARRLGARRRAGPRRRAADAAEGRRPDRRRPPARCGSRPRSGSGPRAGPTRSATTSIAAADDRARARRRLRRARRPVTDPVGGRAADPRADRLARSPRARPSTAATVVTARRSSRPHGAPHVAVRGVVPALRRRPRARLRAGSPSPRRSRISSGSSGTAGPSGTSRSANGDVVGVSYTAAQ